MNEQQAHALLQRYFDGATSLNEEQALQAYFAQGSVPDSLRAYRPLFAFFAEEQAVQPPAGKPRVRRISLSWYAAAGMAASIALLLTLGSPKAQGYAYYVNGKRVYDQAAALKSAESKLQRLAASLQKARSGLSALDAVQEGGSSLRQLDKLATACRHVEERLQEVAFKN
jgi:hypothetical protein